jgi:hypothetical protein
MRITTWMLTGCISAAMVLATVPAFAQAGHPCAAAPAAAPSDNSSFHQEANGIFQNIEADAQEAVSQADRLQSYELSPDLSWESHAQKLDQLRAEVNAIGDQVCRLEAIRPDLALWQQKTLDRIAPTLQLMADNTEDAITFLNRHQNELWLPAYQKYITNIDNEAGTLSRSAGNAFQYSQATKSYRALKHELGG